MNTCIKCGYQMSGDAVFCGKCGTVNEPPQPKQKTCPNCSSNLEEGLIFCDKCGTKYEVPAQPQYTPPPASYAQPNVPPVQVYQSYQPKTEDNSKSNGFLWANIIISIIGFIIVFSTETFHIGEILVFIAAACGFATKKPLGIIFGIADLVLLAYVWGFFS